MSTIRIDMDGQNQRPKICCSIVSNVTIDRSLPGALSSHMSASAWTQFCDDIDEVLTPIGEESKRKMRKYENMIFLFNAIIFCICVTWTLTVALTVESINTSIFIYQSKFIYQLSFIAFFVTVEGVIHCRNKQRARAQLQQVEKDVEIVCRAAEGDKMSGGFSFRLREEAHYQRLHSNAGGSYTIVSHVTHYIECSISASPSMMEQGSTSGTLAA